MRLIDADELVKNRYKANEFNSETRSWGTYVVDLIDICDAETIDPAKHGKWVSGHEWMPIYVCSICGIRALFDDSGDHAFSNYCPNCGAKMDGE